MSKIKKSYIKLLSVAAKPVPSGYTLLESLVALVVVGILITSVAPMLALTTATRVQSRRVDQATQALRAYIDGVRGGTLPPPQRFVVTNPSVNFTAPDYGNPPSTSLFTPYYPSNPDAGTLIDTNGDGFDINDPQDLVIQAIRPVAFCNPACTPNAVPELNALSKQGYLMALRVYRADAFSGGGVPDLTEQAGVFIGTLGSRRNPLVTSVAEVYTAGNLDEIKKR